jgi:AcrR family transcriptional regulator
MPTKSRAAGKTVPPPRTRRGNADDAQRMRSMLTEAALALFSEGGLDAVSMRAVSARLGISAMTPYHYFADKAELLSALWQHVLKDHHKAVSRAVERRTGARARLRAYIDAFLHFYKTHDGGFERCEDRVTRHVDHVALMRLDLSLEDVTRGIERGDRAALLACHEAGVSGCLGRQDCHQALSNAGFAQCLPPRET